MIIVRFVIAALVGYLLGSIPSGVIVSRLFGGADPRTKGSGKTGTTNVLRTLGPGPAALVVVGDIGKGVVAVLLARYLFAPVQPGMLSATQQAGAEAVAGLAALLGHNHSIYIRFSGGRGVATGGGAMLAMSPVTVGFAVIAMAIPIATTRYVSLGSIMGCVACGVVDSLLVITGHDIWPHAIYAVLAAAFVIFSHRDNIQRLLAGTERKLGQATH